VLDGVEIAVPEQLVVPWVERVDALIGLAVLAVALGVVGPAQHDRALVAWRPFLDLPGARLLGVREVEVEVERADVGLVADLAGIVLGVVLVDLHGPVVAGRVVGQRG
jgi:hypothetical protein